MDPGPEWLCLHQAQWPPRYDNEDQEPADCEAELGKQSVSVQVCSVENDGIGVESVGAIREPQLSQMPASYNRLGYSGEECTSKGGYEGRSHSGGNPKSRKLVGC